MPGSFNGYEKETADAAQALIHGQYEVRRAGIGALLLYLPFILLSKIFTSPLTSQIIITYTPVFYSALIIPFLYLIARLVTKNTKIAIAFALAIGVGSALWPYSSLGMEYQMTLLITILAWAFLRWQNTIEHPFFLGFVLAMLSITKSYGIIIALPLTIAVYLALRQCKKTKLLTQSLFLIKLFGPLVLLFGANSLLTYSIYHTLSGSYSLGHEFQLVHWWEGFYGMFFSFGKSIFFLNPLLIISVMYWPKFYREYKALSLFILGSFVMLLLINAPFMYWTDETWGSRKLVPIIPLLHLPLVLFFKNSTLIKKIIFGIFLCVAFYIQLLGVSYKVGKQLAVLRELNKDTLETMRFNPELSALRINHLLLSSYIKTITTKRPIVFSYQEETWFRWTKGQDDVVLTNGSIDLQPYQQPDIFWIAHRSAKSKVVMMMVIIILGGAGLMIYVKSKTVYPSR
jgi:hypothetical protein